MRVDFSFIGFVEFVAYLAIANFFLRFLATRYHDQTLGKALGYLFF